MTGRPQTWGMLPVWAAAVASYVWLGLSVWVLAAPGNTAPAVVKGGCVGCWLLVGIWVWERTDQINDEHGHGPAAAGGLLFRFAFTLLFGALAMCFAVPIGLAKKTRRP